MKAHHHRVKGPSCERKLGRVADQQWEVPGTQGHHPLGSIQANDQCPRRHPFKVREQRSHPTAQIQHPPGLRKRELLDQPSGQAHQDRGPQVAIGLGLGAVVAGDAETGGWSLVGWWGRWHGGKGTLPRAPSVPPTPSHPAGWSTQALPGLRTRATQKQIHALRIGAACFYPRHRM
jgi:hypothetical protein